jgi:streptogramin lyase
MEGKVQSCEQSVRRKGLRAAWLAGALLLALPPAARGASCPIMEFGIPADESHPSAITAGPDGNVWFTEASGNKIGRITPAGLIAKFPIPRADSFPLGITAGPDGNLWFTEAGAANQIGRITPTGVISEFPTPTAGSIGVGITAGPDGNLWFAEAAANRIGRMDLIPPRITVAVSPGRLPATGRLVPVTVSGTLLDKLGDVNPATAAFAVTDKYGAIQPTGRVVLQPGGSYAFNLRLEARRNPGDRAGRVYEITVRAADMAGNLGEASAQVVIFP